MNTANILNGILGQQQATAAHGGQDNPGPGGGLNLKSLISGPGGLATGALAGGLATMLLTDKKPKKLAKTALQVGGVALVGGLAYSAWQNWKAGKQPGSDVAVEPAAGTDAFVPPSTAEQEDLKLSLVRAMIAAAKADGQITTDEQRMITNQLEALEIEGEYHAFVQGELCAPLDIDAVAGGAKTKEQAAEIYAASLLAIDPKGQAEKGYLAMLAARLELDPALVQHLHAAAGAPLTAQAA